MQTHVEEEIVGLKQETSARERVCLESIGKAILESSSKAIDHVRGGHLHVLVDKLAFFFAW